LRLKSFLPPAARPGFSASGLFFRRRFLRRATRHLVDSWCLRQKHVIGANYMVIMVFFSAKDPGYLASEPANLQA
jgi:hypothetical protein